MLTGEGVAKIGDVGLAWVRSQGDPNYEFAQAVSCYAAPEAVLGDECTEKVRFSSEAGSSAEVRFRAKCRTKCRMVLKSTCFNHFRTKPRLLLSEGVSASHLPDHEQEDRTYE